jgi:uncharacterized protein (TIGR00369 family)
MEGSNKIFRTLRGAKANRPPIMVTLGMKVDRLGEGEAKLSMDVAKRFYNPMGTLHGGIMTDLADACMGLATISTLNAGERFTTLELKMNFLRPVYQGKIVCEAKVLHRGRTIALAEAVVRNSEGKEVARGVATQMILRATNKRRGQVHRQGSTKLAGASGS